ncbi:MAG: metallophosphoesterase family protein [Gammaproteobacteria bacterium]|jgi:predicted MPP superfamily phosphohydrolase
MALCPPDDANLESLQERVGRIHLQQRLGIERDYESRIFGQGRTFFHIENWYSVHSVIRNCLRLLLLHGRGRRNARRIALRQNHFVLPSLPDAFEGFTILQISDMHLDMAADFPHALIEAVRKVDYDLCVLTGDFRAKTFGPYTDTLQGMALVRTHLKGEVYGVLGNHDSICMVPGLESLQIRMLLNEHLPITRGDQCIYLAGVDDAHYYRADNLEKAADAIPVEAVSILLAHTPEIYRHAAHAGFSILLCGHTHGGQICLPGGIPLMCNARCAREFCSGSWSYQGMAGYTSAGSGACVVDVRLNCPPEITLHHLHGA